EDVLAFARGERFVCVVNISQGAVELPAYESVLLASGALEDGQLPCDTAIWLRIGRGAIVATSAVSRESARSGLSLACICRICHSSPRCVRERRQPRSAGQKPSGRPAPRNRG